MRLHFGALADPLYKQLGLPRARLRFLQRVADAVTLLAVNQFLTEREIHAMHNRILRRVIETFGKELVAQKDVSHV